jgi:hypothetical protein
MWLCSEKSMAIERARQAASCRPLLHPILHIRSRPAVTGITRDPRRDPPTVVPEMDAIGGERRVVDVPLFVAVRRMDDERKWLLRAAAD